MRKSDICRYLFYMGVSPRHKGFSYICELLYELGSAEGAAFCADAACKAFFLSHGIDPRTAERCMRYAIEYAWEACDGRLRGMYAQRHGGECGSRSACPQLAEFLCAMLWDIEERMGKEAP